MPPDFTTFDWERIGIASILALGIIGFLRGWIVPGTEYRDRIRERDQQTALAERAVDALNLVLKGEG